MKINLRVLFIFPFLSLAFSTLINAQENIALGKQAGASGITQRKPPVYLTDGDYGTYCQPSDDSGTQGFYFELDLEDEYNFDRIILFNQLAYDYRIDIYTEHFGIRGELVWSADIVKHGADGQDLIKADSSPEGEFRGRYIRITNTGTVPFAPSISEIEVYEAPLPIINYFETDAGNITQSGNTNLPTSANISWQTSGATSLVLNQGIGYLYTASGEIRLSPDSTTTYTLTAKNSYGSISKNITIAIDRAVLDPIITEFMASNLASLEDEDGDKPDWIEIYNPNNFSLNIKDYYLTDDIHVPDKWKIPSRSVAPKAYMIIFASDKDRTSLETPLHTNFSLKTEGEYLALVGKNGVNILQQYPVDYPFHQTYPQQIADVSYGLDSLGNIGYLRAPTPHHGNTIAEDGFVEEVKFTPNRGIYNAPIHVSISCASADATIRFTTDGSEPTETNGSIYSEPLKLSTTQVIRARAFKPGLIPTKMKTHSYIFIDEVVNSDVMDKKITADAAYRSQIEIGLAELPSISLVLSDTINTTTEVQTSLEWIDPIKKEDLQVNAGIQNFGGSFTDFAKKNFRLYFRGVYGDTKLKHPVFEGFEHTVSAVEKFDQIELRAGGHDMKMRGFYMSNRYVDDIMLETGHLNPHGRFVNLYINGVYWGQYHLRERWNDAMFAEYFNTEKEDFEAINGNLNLGGWSPIEIPYAGNGSAWENVKSLRENYMAVKNYLDVPQYINFMVLFMYGNSENEYRTVGSVYPGNGFKFYFNDADGFTRDGGDRTAMDQPGRKPADGPGSVFSMLLKEGHPDYKTLLADQIHTLLFNDGVLTPNRMTAILNERCEEVKNSIVAECARWGYRTPANWESAKNSYVTEVLPYRTATLISQLTSSGFYPSINAPIFSQNGGIVPIGYHLTMSSNTGTIYYTADGSDPRLSGGEISDNAVPYSVSGKEYVKFVGTDSNVSALIPTDGTLLSTWTTTDYTESVDWLKNTGGAGVGYDQQTTYESHIDLSVKDEMYGKNTSAYLRYTFEVDNPDDFESLELKMKCDDGFVAYLNGEAIASVNAPATLSWNSNATASYNDGSAVVFTTITITHSDVLSLLKKGSNVLAIHGLNLSLTSSDFLIEPEFFGTKKNTSNNLDYVFIDEPLKINARAYNGSTWSALSQADFELSDVTAIYEFAAPEGKAQIIVHQFPNPFKDQTTISFVVNQGSESVLEVFDMLGKMVWTKKYSIEKGIKYSETIDASNWESGMYFYRLTTNTGVVKTGKMMHDK